MKRLLRNVLWLSAITLLASCSGSDGVGDDEAVTVPTVEMEIVVQTPQTTRAAGDPGDEVQEVEDWDSLYVILAYTGQYDTNGTWQSSTAITWKALGKSDFEALPSYDSEGLYRALRLDVPAGTALIYGVTFSDGCYNLRDRLLDINKKSAGYNGIDTLTISNTYANGDYNKFCSVATGICYGTDTKDTDYTPNTPSNDSLIYIVPANETDKKQYYYLLLTRLAAKIDIQWDAEDAYVSSSTKYTDVRVTDFTFNGGGGTNVTGEGSGRLFPTHAAKAGLVAISGSRTFVNTSVISQRNGRQYHYVFPDGVSTPNVTFNVTGKLNGTDEASRVCTLSRSLPLAKATWYKVNATIKGLGSGTDNNSWTGSWE